MRYAWCLAAVVVLSACDARASAKKTAAEEEAARRNAEGQAPVARGERSEDPHVLITADAALVTSVKEPAVGMIRVDRAGVISCVILRFQGGAINRTIIGAGTTGGCCTTSDPPEKQAMGGTFKLLRDEAACGTDAPPCAVPVMLDGDYKAPWLQVRKVLEIMDKSHAHMTHLVFSTSIAQENLKGISATLPENWNVTDDLPATAKQIEVAAKGKELQVTVDGTAYKDVASAVGALQKAGVKEVGIHPADPKTPLWAVVKGVEISKAIAPTGPVRFVMLDK